MCFILILISECRGIKLIVHEYIVLIHRFVTRFITEFIIDELGNIVGVLQSL